MERAVSVFQHLMNDITGAGTLARTAALYGFVFGIVGIFLIRDIKDIRTILGFCFLLAFLFCFIAFYTAIRFG